MMQYARLWRKSSNIRMKIARLLPQVCLSSLFQVYVLPGALSSIYTISSTNNIEMKIYSV